MRLLALAAVLVVVLLVVAVVLAVRERTARAWAAAEARAVWADDHSTVGGVTRVVVRRTARLPSGEERVLAESVIEEIADGDPDWHGRFDAARARAYDRAIDLNGRSYLG
ncbi:hypothetical protein KUM42_09510 [Modestobacter sp. L9-4]|uniref:hypothetical protein n=1 Tax=Modestobacter sp. L9-4 TaxID=2851567 RepID=UPI001C775B22|nr:hypothetical protein [Modestobacter sp. L9-4]QXG77705.1 hypothetical protein KUM42_09510 [Modestobacter sp. L9-4]